MNDDRRERSWSFEFVGGELCLDFANTTSARSSPSPHERIVSFGDLAEWSESAGVIDARTAGMLRRVAQRRVREATAILRRGIALRESIYGVFAAIAQGAEPGPGELRVLNRELKAALAHRELGAEEGKYRWKWEPSDALEQLLWPIALSAASLLTDPQLEHVGQCSGKTCDWLFIDASRNHTRRWCDMSNCGNRAKARRHYARRKRY